MHYSQKSEIPRAFIVLLQTYNFFIEIILIESQKLGCNMKIRS